MRTCARHSSRLSPRSPTETTSTALMLRSVLRASASPCWTASSELFVEVPTSSMIFTTDTAAPFTRGKSAGPYSVGLGRWAWRQDERRPRGLREVEVVAQVAEHAYALSHRGARIGAAVGLRV